jgi:hypothetical protein
VVILVAFDKHAGAFLSGSTRVRCWADGQAQWQTVGAGALMLYLIRDRREALYMLSALICRRANSVCQFRDCCFECQFHNTSNMALSEYATFFRYLDQSIIFPGLRSLLVYAVWCQGLAQDVVVVCCDLALFTVLFVLNDRIIIMSYDCALFWLINSCGAPKKYKAIVIAASSAEQFLLFVSSSAVTG